MWLILLLCCGGLLSAADPSAEEILRATGFSGGLIVHLGCADGRLTADLGADEKYLVHGLDTERENVAAARRHIQSLGTHGRVSVDTFDGRHLPYADNLVNLIVAEDLGGVSEEEVMRALAPLGVAYIKRQGRWTKTAKPWPDDIDQWTHHLHDAGGNAVANDRVVGPPRYLQWQAGPLWARSHGWTPSVSAMVSSRGRLFYICDETLTAVDGTVPSKWFLVARDAFSGVLLWKRPVPHWGSAEFSGTPNTGAGVTTGRFTMPPQVGKRLVAIGDTVYVTLGATAPVTALDAATGEERRVFAGTDNTDEILYTDGLLILAINPSRRPVDGPPAKRVCAVDTKTGRMLWSKGPFSGIRASKGQDPLGRLELAAGDGKVFVLTTEAIETLAADSGKRLWRIERPSLPEHAVRRIGFAGMYEYLLTVMVYRDGVVLLAQPEPNTHHTYHTMPGTLYAFDAADGQQMWKHAYGGWGHCTPPDVFVVDDVVWTHVNAETEFGSVWGNGFRAKDSSTVDYRIQAIDLRTGKVREELPTRDIFNVGHHHRCYRNRMTSRFLMASRRGVEFVDLASGENYQNHWVRSGCLLGNLPCNGMVYVAPHPCSCYIEAKLTGFNALASTRKQENRNIERPIAARLERGPAYGQIPSRPSSLANPSSRDWPTYRHDCRRSGATESSVGTNLAVAWQHDIGTRPSGLVVADGKALVAGVDTHTVHALDATDGKSLWTHTAGARVDSPPTVHEGMAIFGSCDGRVYCLRNSDGALVWRFDAGPQRRLMTAFDQLESPWPVPGSVLVDRGKCWFAAGRLSYVDGGIHVYALDAATGKVEHQKTIYSPDPTTGKMLPEPSPNLLAGLLNDIPVTDGANVFIRQMQVSAAGDRVDRHLHTTGGFLDSSWFGRTFWKFGPARTSGLMVLGDDVAYGVELYESGGREAVFTPGTKAYRLACYPLTVSANRVKSGDQAKPKRGGGIRPLWQQHVGIRITAMVRAGETLFVAGSPDVVDPEDPHGAWEGRRGGVLAAYATSDGEKLAEHKLPSPPVWDGMAAVEGCLYLSLLDGKIVCLREVD